METIDTRTEERIRLIATLDFNDLRFNEKIPRDITELDIEGLYYKMTPEERESYLTMPMDTKRDKMIQMLRDLNKPNWDWDGFVEKFVEKTEKNYEQAREIHDKVAKTPGPIAEKVREERPVLFKKLKGNQDALGVRDYSILEEKPEADYEYEYVNHPSHYNLYDIEVIEMMRRIWGEDNTKLWCEMTAFKYRMRMGTKPGEPVEKDLNKEKWYLKKSKDLDAE